VGIVKQVGTQTSFALLTVNMQGLSNHAKTINTKRQVFDTALFNSILSEGQLGLG